MSGSPLPSFTSRKLDVQRAVISDPRASAGQKLMFLYVLHESWEEDGEPHVVSRATVPDQAIMEDVPGHAVDTTLYRTRKRWKELGYWNYASGKGVKSTVYFIFDSPIRPVLDRLEEARRDRKRDADERQAALKIGVETLQSQQSAIKAKRKTAQNAGGETVENAGGDASQSEGGTLQIAKVPTALKACMSPLSTPPQDSLSVTVQDVATEAVAIPTDAGPDRSGWDAEDWQALFDERAGFLEFDAGYSRTEAERMAAEEISEMRATC